MTEATRSAQSRPSPPGKYDAARRRYGKRTRRERGCWLYLPAEELDKTGFGGDAPPPYYRMWGSSRGRVVVQLYKEGP